MVDGSAQRGALLSCCYICWERGFVRWGCHSRCVVVQGGRGVVGFVFCSLRVECLRVLQHCGSVCPVADSSLMRATAATVSDVVDVYNSATGAWSTAQLSVLRGNLAAASVGNVALFAGGETASALLCRERGMVVTVVYGCVRMLNVCVCCIIAVLFAPRPLPLSCAPLQVVVILMLWMCTTEKQGHGRRLSSACGVAILQLYLSGTWLCSLGVKQQVRCCAGRGGGWEFCLL
jgi:hypothetical protein